jgi:hypothetical protein
LTPSRHGVSFDQLVGDSEHVGRHSETERFGGLEVYTHLEFDWQLNWQFGWLFATQNPIDITGIEATLGRPARKAGPDREPAFENFELQAANLSRADISSP